ncbi:ABC transporter permease [Microbacterium sp. NPDC077184]|uniref:ABC transporter permease n=1 Tax=Microbacterium sp. NPDC077184 TaxID=3154764 RepID=UPI003440B45B
MTTTAPPDTRIPPPRDGREHRPGHTASSVIERFGLLILLVMLVVVFSILPESGAAFRSGANIQALVANQSVGLVVALALLLPLAAGYFDFSVGAVTAASSVVTAALLSNVQAPLPVAIGAGILFGAAIGVFIGVLVAILKMNAFIATLGVATLLGGAIFAYTGGLQITSGIPQDLIDLGSKSLWGVPFISVAAAVMAVAVWYLMSQTPFGRRLFAIGSNAAAAELTGTRVTRVRLLAFVVSGSVAGVAGVLLLARQGAATSDNGMSMLFPALTAVLLSTIVIDVGRPSVLGTVIGLLFVSVSISGLTLVGAPAWVGAVFNGGALLVAVGFARLSVLWRRSQ